MVYVQLKPGAEATADELREFCRKEIPERAAVPVQVVPIPVMSVTGVGKIFKPALRLDAAQRAFDAALAPLRAEGVAAEVSVGRRHPRHARDGDGRGDGQGLEGCRRPALRRAIGARSPRRDVRLGPRALAQAVEADCKGRIAPIRKPMR